jgi:hypothetical protein
MRSWKSHRLTSHTWLGLNPKIGRPLSRTVGAIGLFLFIISISTVVVTVVKAPFWKWEVFITEEIEAA